MTDLEIVAAEIREAGVPMSDALAGALERLEGLRAMLDAAQEGGKWYAEEIERLREELAMTQGQRNASNREIERLHDENAKLREALEQIGDTACGEASHQYIALQALAAMREGK